MGLQLEALILLLAFATNDFVQAADRTTEAGEAAIEDPYEECQYYSFPAVEENRSKFPTQFEPAYIVDGDEAANALFDQISATIPDIQPKGTLSGDFSSVNYGSDDPDCWWTWSNCVTPKHEGLPMDVAAVPEPRTLGYGFDDGPNCSHNAFYDYLQEKEQKATMFYIGSNVLQLPLEAQRGVVDGHEICIHSWSHRYMTAFDNRGAFAEMYYSMQAVKLVAGVTPTCWRPPFGDIDDRIRAIAAGLNLTTMLWKYDSNDWEISDGSATVEEVDANYQHLIDDLNDGAFDTEGAIILTHEIDNATMSMAVKWYDALSEAFDYIVPVGVALNTTKPYPDSDIALPTFDEHVSSASGSSGSSGSSDPGTPSDSNNSSESTLSTSSESASSTPSTQPSSASSDSESNTDGAIVFGVSLSSIISAAMAALLVL